MDLDTYFKLRNTTREKFIEEEVQPVAKKRFERSLILDEIVRSENLQVDNEALDAEFNQTLNSLVMQGVDLSKMKGGRRQQQQVAQAVAMESANRVLTRKALDILKSIATGEYKPSEIAKSDMISEGGPVAPVEAEEDAAETEATSSEAPTESMSAEETETKPE
jgi:FKBP-type peptidyl-prolyl cis-trans isomerase (trigger factor)